MINYATAQNPTINSNAVRWPTAGGSHAVAIYNATTPDDQWAHMTISTIQGASAVTVMLKLRHANTPTLSGYECRANRNNASIKSEIAKRVNGTPTTLISENLTAWANGDEMDCEVQGSTIILSRVTGGVTTELLRFNDATSGKTPYIKIRVY